MELFFEVYSQSIIPLIYCFILSLIFISIYWYCCYKLKYWIRKGIQQLRNSNKIFGDFKDGILFRTSPGYHLGNIYRKASSDAPYVGFYIFHKPCLLLRDPEIIKQMLVRDFENFSDRNFAGSQQKDSIGMINLFGLKNPAWRYLRRKITPTLTRSKLKQMLPLMMETAKPMRDYLKTIDNENGSGVIDVQDVNWKYTADVIANIAFASKSDSFQNPNSKYTKRLMDFFHSFKRMVALVTVFFVPELVTLVGSPMLFDSTFIREIFWSAVESRERSGQKRGDYIDSIIQLKNGEQNSLYKLEGNNLMYQSGTFFTGFESSSTVSAFTLMQLARNGACQERARRDIMSAVNQHGWSFEAFHKMKYLDQCIAEGVRIHPPVSTIDRCAHSDYQIPNTDIIIEKGTAIYVSLYGLHGDRKYFDQPDLFNPDRFGEDSVISDAYMPFGVGPRQCVGVEIGRLHVRLVLAVILSEYEVYQRPSELNKMDSRSTFTAAADGIHVEFRPLVHKSG